MGFEPIPKAWKAFVLAINTTVARKYIIELKSYLRNKFVYGLSQIADLDSSCEKSPAFDEFNQSFINISLYSWLGQIFTQIKLAPLNSDTPDQTFMLLFLMYSK